MLRQTSNQFSLLIASVSLARWPHALRSMLLQVYHHVYKLCSSDLAIIFFEFWGSE